MQAVSSSEGRRASQNASQLRKAKLSVNDLLSDDFKRAWLILKDIHDREIHRLQMKLTSMRKARLIEGRRCGPVANKPDTQEASDSKSCDRCLMNETYKNMLQQEFSNLQQKCLAQIAELTVENNKLKEENRKLSEKIKANLPRIHLSLSSSDDEDFIPSIQMKRKRVYTVKEPSQPVQLPPRSIMKPQNEERQSVRNLNIEPNPDDIPINLRREEVFVVPESSFIEDPSGEENLVQEANVLPSYAACSLATTLETSKKDDLISIPSLSGVKKQASTQKFEKSNFFWNFPSESSGEPVIVSETSEENMPCNRKNVLPKKKQSDSGQVFPVDYTSKYSQNRRLSVSGISYKNDIPMIPSTAPLPSKEKTTLKNSTQFENVRTCEKPTSNSQIVSSGSWLQRKIKK